MVKTDLFSPKQTWKVLNEIAARLETTAAALVQSIEEGRPYFVHSLKGGCSSRLVALGEIHGIIDEAYALGVDVESIEIIDLRHVPSDLRRAAAAELN